MYYNMRGKDFVCWIFFCAVCIDVNIFIYLCIYRNLRDKAIIHVRLTYIVVWILYIFLAYFLLSYMLC